MQQQYQQALQLIRQYNTIIIHRHSNPDGDAIGSQVGLKRLLAENFPDKHIFAVGDPAGRYGCIEGSTMDEVADDLYKNALAIVCDTSAKRLISDQRYPTAAATLRFDHHLFVEQICDVEVVDTTKESCAGLIADFAVQTGLKLSPNSAKPLFTGMVTDSGRFRYDSTNANTLRLAATLLEQGLDLNEIFVPLYADSYENIKLRAQFVLQVQFTKNNVAYIYTERARVDQLAAEGISPFSISRGMVGVMADMRGVNTWVNFTETADGVMCELRSNKYNINPIAVKYGGGGHEKASGACLASREQAMQMLDDLDKLSAEETK